MFEYKKFLEYPVKISSPDTRLANIIITQYGGAYGKILYQKQYNCLRKSLYCFYLSDCIVNIAAVVPLMSAL